MELLILFCLRSFKLPVIIKQEILGWYQAEADLEECVCTDLTWGVIWYMEHTKGNESRVLDYGIFEKNTRILKYLVADVPLNVSGVLMSGDIEFLKFVMGLRNKKTDEKYRISASLYYWVSADSVEIALIGCKFYHGAEILESAIVCGKSKIVRHFFPEITYEFCLEIPEFVKSATREECTKIYRKAIIEDNYVFLNKYTYIWARNTNSCKAEVRKKFPVIDYMILSKRLYLGKYVRITERQSIFSSAVWDGNTEFLVRFSWHQLIPPPKPRQCIANPDKVHIHVTWSIYKNEYTVVKIVDSSVGHHLKYIWNYVPFQF